MESYYLTDIIKILKEKKIGYFTLNDFGRLFAVTNQNTLYKKIDRLEKKGIIKKLIKSKYFFLFADGNDFTTANFLYQPSYISLESALSFYGVITGFSYRITSLSPKKTRNITIGQKEYTYSHIGQNLFWGYEKKDDFIIAEPEKAFLDYLYFYSKGLRTLHLDEFELSDLNLKKLLAYEKKFRNDILTKIVKKFL